MEILKDPPGTDTSGDHHRAFAVLLGVIDVMALRRYKDVSKIAPRLLSVVAEIERLIQDINARGLPPGPVATLLREWTERLQQIAYSADPAERTSADVLYHMQMYRGVLIMRLSNDIGAGASQQHRVPTKMPAAHESVDHGLTTSRDDSTTWPIEIDFDGTPSTAAVGLFLARLARALESVPGVSVEILSAYRGSLRINLGMKMSSLLAKEQVKGILERGRREAYAWYKGVSVEEQEKLAAETRSIMSETDRAEKEAIETHDFEQISRIQDLEKRELENERLRLENEEKTLKIQQLKMELAEKASHLIREALIEPDVLRVAINGQQFFTVNDGKVAIEEAKSMDDIDRGQRATEPT